MKALDRRRRRRIVARRYAQPRRSRWLDGVETVALVASLFVGLIWAMPH
jgi:hypothetical protein